MRRRELLVGLLATTTAPPLWAAEPNRIYRLAVWPNGESDPPVAKFFWSGFFARLRQLGYTEGKNLVADRYNLVRPERYEEIARKMVEAKPHVIALGLNHRFTSELAKMTSTIPLDALIGSVD